MSIRSRRFLQTAAVGALVGFGFLAPRPSLALDDDGKQNVFSSLVSVFDFRSRDSGDDIDYRERSPIVLPPKMELAKPQASLPRPSAWPNDPDVIRRQKAAKAVSVTGILTGGKNYGSPRRLTHDETMSERMDPGNEPQQLTPGGKCRTGDCRMSSPELRAQGDRFNAVVGNSPEKNVLVAGQEPPRKYLTDPPPGYRKATQNVKATQEAPVIKHDSALDYVRGLMDKKNDDD